MKSWGAVFIIAMGFALGFILAGISGINAGLKAAQTQTRIGLTKIEDFWTRTDLSETDLRKYVNNKSCVLSEKYFLASAMLMAVSVIAMAIEAMMDSTRYTVWIMLGSIVLMALGFVFSLIANILVVREYD